MRSLSLLLLLGQTAWADLTIIAEVDKDSVALNDQIVLAVTVSGPHASLPDPTMPALPNFSIYSSGRSQNISFVNGAMASSIVHTFVLVPHFVGKGTIAPISIVYQGKTVKTQPIQIIVQPPGPGGTQAQAPAIRRTAAAAQGGAARGPDLFATAEVDKKNPFVNEQATLTIKFHTAVSLMGNPQYTPPALSGFMAEDLPPERHGETVVHGRRYYFSEIKTAVFPAQAGKLTIGHATVAVQVQQDLAVDPFAPDFFQKFFSQGIVSGQTRNLSSEPVVLTAEALPEKGKPAGFSGAVGSFSITAAVDRTHVKVGEAVNVTATVQGIGNLKVIDDPKMPELTNFRVYETVSSLNTDKKEDLVRGSKVFKTVLVPRVSGSLIIPPITFSYFDPAKREYLTAATLPIALTIAPGEAGATAVAPNSPAGPAAPQGLTAVSEDIRYLKTGMEAPLFTRILRAVAAGGLANGLPFLFFAGALSTAQYREHWLSDRKGARFRGALKAALGRIKKAADSGDPHKASALMADALAHFLADKLDESASGLTVKRVAELIKGRQPQLAEERVAAVKELWEELDVLRFAPQAGKADKKLPERIAVVLKSLDKEIKR